MAKYFASFFVLEKIASFRFPALFLINRSPSLFATVYKGNIIKFNNGLPILRRDTAQTRLVCCALPGASPALAAASYPFVDLPPRNTLRCKLFPSGKFTIHLFPQNDRS